MSYDCINRPDRTADVLMVLHDRDGWTTVKEIASEIGADPATVRTVTVQLLDEERIESRPDLRFPCRKMFQIK